MAKNTRRKQGDPKVAIAYLRVSTEEQFVNAQRDEITAWAAKERIQIAAWHEDADISGASDLGDRPGLVAAIGALRPNNAGILVLIKRDRLARDAYIAMGIERAVQTSGARIMTTDGMANGTSDVDAFMRQILDAVAQYERALIRGRTKAALQAKKKRFERIGTVSYGFSPVPKKDPEDEEEVALVVPNPDEQAVIARVAELRREGKTPGKIARALALEGVRSRKGTPFQPIQIRRLRSRQPEA